MIDLGSYSVTRTVNSISYIIQTVDLVTFLEEAVRRVLD
jgi:hypothetical protein